MNRKNLRNLAAAVAAIFLMTIGCDQKPPTSPAPAPENRSGSIEPESETGSAKPSGRSPGDPAPPTPAGRKQNVLFQTDFEKMEVGAEPEGWILDGGFAVAAFENQKVLSLPGNPLSTYSALVHPASFDQKRLEKLLIESSRSGQISARIHTLRKGRRLFSRFGVGLGGAEGFKLLVAANQGQLQLWHREDKLARLPFDWQSGRWVHVRLAVFPRAAGEWVVQGKAWHGENEPEKWMIGVRIRQQPPVGRPALWATPYAGKPIHFDDVSVRTHPTGP